MCCPIFILYPCNFLHLKVNSYVSGGSLLTLISCATRHSVECTPEGPWDESLITAGHSSYSWSSFNIYYWLCKFKWRWQPTAPHMPCSLRLLKTHYKVYIALYVKHFVTVILTLLLCLSRASPFSLLAYMEPNSTFGWWFLVFVCMVSIWHLAERYACAAWPNDSIDILDLNVAHAVLHHNVCLKPWISFPLL